MAREVELKLRPTFRKAGKEALQRFAADLRAAGSARPRAHGGPAGGSLPAAASKLRVRIKRWGAVVPVHQLGQKLTWFVRGTYRQPARPARLEVDEKALAAEVEAELERQIGAWDRQAGGVA